MACKLTAHVRQRDGGCGRCFDHQHPARGKYKTHDTSLELFSSWVAGQQKKGLVCEPFKVGALNQIALQRDPGKYARRGTEPFSQFIEALAKPGRDS